MENDCKILIPEVREIFNDIMEQSFSSGKFITIDEAEQLAIKIWHEKKQNKNDQPITSTIFAKCDAFYFIGRKIGRICRKIKMKIMGRKTK